MKRHFSIKHIAVFTVICLCVAAILNSCKRESITTDKNSQDEVAVVIKATKDRYGALSAPVVYPVNKIAGRLDYDANGNEVIIAGRNLQNARVLCTGYDCATAESFGLTRGDIEEVYTLSSAEIYAGCGTQNGTKVTVTWNLSVPYIVLNANPANATQLSKGRMRFLSSSGTLLYNNINITPVSITSLGTDPSCSNNSLFRVTYSLSNVMDSYLGNGNKLECSLFMYTNCTGLAPSYVTQWTQAVVFPATGTYAAPCSRIDKLWINPSTGTAQSQCATVAGAYVTCTGVPAGFTRTTSQQVEYRKRLVTTSFDWNDQNANASSIVYNGVLPPVATGAASSTVSSCCGVLFLKFMVQGASPNGWLVRYRNIYTGCSTAPAATTPSATWTPGTFTTEYWPY